jgi:hypothetical protein
LQACAPGDASGSGDVADASDTMAAAMAVGMARADSVHIAALMHESAGEVAPATGAATDSAAAGKPVSWLTDANVLSVVGTIVAEQAAAANVELQAWRSDTVRAFAAASARTYAELQHALDSTATAERLSPVAPAVGVSIAAALQRGVDSLAAARGPGLDRAFVAERIAADTVATNYLDALSGLTRTASLQALLSDASMQVAAERAQAQRVQSAMATAASASK